MMHEPTREGLARQECAGEVDVDDPLPFVE
jgi:hypothetical protein